VQAISDKEKEEFFANLKHLRQSAGWTQEELGKRVGVTRQTITAIENNKMVPSTTLYLALAGLFVVGAALIPILGGVTGAIGLNNTLKKLFD
jgi:putative transcriptional regulator